jgi:3-methyladenine DNA glycosylase AlkD
MSATAGEVEAKLKSIADAEKAQILQRFFKTGPGQYGEGDKFLGIQVPELRQVVNEFKALPLGEVTKLVKSPWHEARLAALLILVKQFAKASAGERKSIYDLYLGHTRWINNWDLVDASAPHIAGAHLMMRSRRPLYTLAKSASLWERRIAIIATLYFVREKDFDDALSIVATLLADREDLIHKATGWVLREIGKRDQQAMEDFLVAHYRNMPRTTLRYAIERLPETRRKEYLRGLI